MTKLVQKKKDNSTCKKQDFSKKFNSCDLCDYQCKKRSTSERHINKKHTKEQSCDDSTDIFKSNESIIILKEKREQVMKKRSFVYSGSMLDKWDV